MDLWGLRLEDEKGAVDHVCWRCPATGKKVSGLLHVGRGHPKDENPERFGDVREVGDEEQHRRRSGFVLLDATDANPVH